MMVEFRACGHSLKINPRGSYVQTLKLPRAARILSVQQERKFLSLDRRIIMWEIHDVKNERDLEDRCFVLVMTGLSIELSSYSEVHYLGTIQHSSQVIYHAYEVDVTDHQVVKRN